MSARAAVMEWIEATEIIVIGIPPSALEYIGLARSRPKTFRSDCRASLIKPQYFVRRINRNYPATGRNRRDGSRRARRLFGGLGGLGPGGFLGPSRHPGIVFRRAASRRHTGRLAADPVRHIGEPFAHCLGASRQRNAGKAQQSPFDFW
jgi:hypothetical protein